VLGSGPLYFQHPFATGMPRLLAQLTAALTGTVGRDLLPAPRLHPHCQGQQQLLVLCCLQGAGAA
jgi:hypothetical protein